MIDPSIKIKGGSVGAASHVAFSEYLSRGYEGLMGNGVVLILIAACINTFRTLMLVRIADSRSILPCH